MSADQHKPVLLDEAIEALAIKADGIYLDGTFGRGGHSRKILDRLNEQGRLLSLDKDPQAIAAGVRDLGSDARLTLVQGSFAELDRWIHDCGIENGVDGILLDLGVSSPQLDDPERGFSFMEDGPLDMRMDPTQGCLCGRMAERGDRAGNFPSDLGVRRGAPSAQDRQKHCDGTGA